MARSAGIVRDGSAAFKRAGFAPVAGRWVAVAVVLAAAAVGAAQRPGGILGKTREDISFSIAPAGGAGNAHTYAIGQVTRNGQPRPAARNMKIEPRTGDFAWTPTESQAGTYEITFLVTGADAKALRTTRRITVLAGPIATGTSKVAQRLRIWHAAGTAAGNTGDFYDNRDGGHSGLKMSLFPQLEQFQYTAEQKKRRLHWGLQLRMLFNHVTIGNSSTSAPVARGGANTRRALTTPRAAGALYTQYRRSHLYVYPEHRDYDPGHNGRGGAYGDLLPANTPYVITSQGSSGSDRAFVTAAAYTLAAFRPEVKKSLTKAGLLMPTVQMIFRLSNKPVKGPKAYLTGIAHPPVFNRANLDVLDMIEMAHDMTAKTVPPMIQLKVVEEDQARHGRDYFDGLVGEKLFDTPAAVARVARSTRHTRRMVVSAKGSYDLNGRPLTYHWVVLQGDAKKIKITPLADDRSVVELHVPYHRRRPIRKGSKMQSNRVDIGAFVYNGRYYSAPGFVSIFSLDNEARTYDAKGRILEVAYGHGITRIGRYASFARGGDIKDHCALLDLIVSKSPALGAAVLRKQFRPGEIAAFQRAEKKLRPHRSEISKGGEKKPVAAQRAIKKILARRRDSLKASAVVRIEDALNAVKNDVNFYFRNIRAIEALHKAAKDKRRSDACGKARDELHALAAAYVGDDKPTTTRPFPDGPAPGRKNLTLYQQNRIEQLNIAILQHVVYPGLLEWQFRPNYVDPRLATPKTWRDVYRYAPDGRLAGWTRHRGDAREHFTADGALVVKKDPLGRPLVARRVAYATSRTTTPWSLLQRPGNVYHHYEYTSNKDPIGRITKTEKR